MLPQAITNPIKCELRNVLDMQYEMQLLNDITEHITHEVLEYDLSSYQNLHELFANKQ